MSKTWFYGDLHFGHQGIIRFTHTKGGTDRIRPFESIEEHDETIIENINKYVKPEDRLYLMGDVAIGRQHIAKVGRLNGRKKLIKGNHDIFKLKDYTPYFDDIVAYRVYPDASLICSHIPIHPCQLEFRFKYNAHGHSHSNLVPLYNGTESIRNKGTEENVVDSRYFNLCPEHTNFLPVEFGDMVSQLRKRNGVE